MDVIFNIQPSSPHLRNEDRQVRKLTSILEMVYAWATTPQREGG